MVVQSQIMKTPSMTIALILLLLGGGILSATGLAEYLGYDEESETEESEPVDDSSEDSEDAGDDSISKTESPQADESPRSLRPPIDHETAVFLPVGPSVLADVEIDTFLEAIEADRRLLSELRKNVPDNRMEAEIFLTRLKDLAERADPVRLAPKANRVLEQAPIYYDWLETEFESAEEEIYEYYVGGAQGFSRALEEFKNAVLMTVMNRLDTAARALQEVYTEPLE